MRVAFSGKKGSGKTTAAQFLVEEHGFQRVSLATPIKEIAKIQENWLEEDWQDGLYEWAETVLPSPIYGIINPTYYEGATPREQLAEMWLADFYHAKSYRELLQRLGTNSGRSIDPDIWINYFARRIPDGDLVMDDLRFANEFDAMERMGFTTVKLKVSAKLRVERLKDRDGFFDAATEGHASETELDSVVANWLMYNTGNLDDLYASIEGLKGMAVSQRVGA